MNMTAITKQYDKLTAPERFTLVQSAIRRGDGADLEALQRSAPRKTWSIPTTRGLVEAFQFLSMFYIMAMQENSTLYFLFLNMDDNKKEWNIGGYAWRDLLNLLQARTLSRDEAWRAVCKEYGVDPDDQIKDLPGAESVSFFVETMKRWQDMNPVKIDTTDYINDLHAVIERSRKEWE